MDEIGQAIDKAIHYLSNHPDEARYTDSYARATLGQGLRVEVVGASGERIVTDMPGGVGGRGQEPSPGWLSRAAVASCVASTVAMEAAREGVTLSSLEVEVDSESDDRGILGMDETVPAGPLSMRIRIRAAGESKERLPELVERGAWRCPSLDATSRAVGVSVEIKAS